AITRAAAAGAPEAGGAGVLGGAAAAEAGPRGVAEGAEEGAHDGGRFEEVVGGVRAAAWRPRRRPERGIERRVGRDPARGVGIVGEVHLGVHVVEPGAGGVVADDGEAGGDAG